MAFVCVLLDRERICSGHLALECIHIEIDVFKKKEESSSFVGLFHVDAAGGSYNMTICSVLLVDDGESKRRFWVYFRSLSIVPPTHSRERKGKR
jgi:hypothetical protein